MPVVKTMNGTQLLVQIGDGAQPTETFAVDCLINTARGIQFQSDTNEFIVPDCDNPDDPAWKEVTKDGLSATITGGGMVHSTSLENFFYWFTSKNTKNVRFRSNLTGANGGGYWQGAFHLTQFEVTGDRNEKAMCSLTLISSGVVTWTDAP